MKSEDNNWNYVTYSEVEFFKDWTENDILLMFLHERQYYKDKKEFSEADRIRNLLEEWGYSIQDLPNKSVKVTYNDNFFKRRAINSKRKLA